MHDAAQSQQSTAKAHRPSTPTVFGAAFVAGAVAAFGINSFFDAHVARSRPQVESEPIFVALRSLPQGAPVTVWDVGLRAWPRAMLPETALRAEDRFEGLILRHPLREGQPLLSVQLAQPVAAADTPGGIGGEEAFAAPVPAADATPALGSAPGPAPVEAGLATIAPPTRDEVERDQVAVVAPVERFEPAAPAAPAAAPAREPTPAIESAAATPAPVAEPVLETVAQPTSEPDVTPVKQPAVEATADLATTAPLAPPQPATTPVTPPDVVETTAPPAPAVAPPVSASEPLAAPPSEAALEATVPQPVVTADTGVPFLATIVAPAAPLSTSPEAIDAPPLLPPAGDDALAGAPADTLATPTAAPADAPPVRTSEPAPADQIAAPGRDGRTVAAEPVAPEAPLVPTPVHPLPPVDAAARMMPARPLVPPTPGTDIEAPLATISRQRAAQIAASRPDSVIAAVDPLVQEQAPVPALPSADVAVPLATIASAHPAPSPRVAQNLPRTGVDTTPRTTTPALAPTTAAAQATAPAGPASTPAPTTVEVVAAPDAEADPDPARPAAVTATPPAHAPLRHLVVPERIAMQAEASFVSPKPAPTEEPAADVPTTATTPAKGTSAGADPRAKSGQTKAPGGNRAAASSTQPHPAASNRSTGGPVMRAIGSLFQGFSGQASPEPSRRR